MKIFKKISLVTLVIFYFSAGSNHFIHPDGYITIIPRYLPYPVFLNVLAGLAEIIFSILLIRPKTRKVATYGIILTLAAFLPVHLQMIFEAPFKLGSLQVTPTLTWVRLLLQPVLMLWAWWHRK